MYKYLTFKERVTTPGIGTYISYGIKCLKITRHSVYCIISVSDVSTKPELVKDIVKRCNRGKLSPIHLLDVIEDSIP